MAKIKKYELNGKTDILIKLGFNEEIDQEEIRIFRQKIIKGLFLPEISGKRKISYKAPFGKSLYEYLGEEIDKETFFFFIVQIIDILKRVRTFGLDENKLLLSLEQICINENNKQLFVTYVPVHTQIQTKVDFLEVVASIVRTATFDLKEDIAFLDEFIEFINRRREFSVEEIETYINDVCPVAFQMPQISVQSTRQKDKAFDTELEGDEKFEAFSVKEKAETFVEAEPQTHEGIELLSKDSEMKPTPVQETQEEDEDDVTVPKSEFVRELTEEDENDTTTDRFEDIHDSLTHEAPEQQDEMTVAIHQNESDIDDCDFTVAIDEPKTENRLFAYMIRVKNCEEIKITGEEFKIGKNKEKTDYTASGNPTISNVHAIVLKEKDRFFIRDNQSTNGTFVEGPRVESGKTIEIFDGDQIQLADEVFEFYIKDLKK